MGWRPVCPGLSMATAITMKSLVVAISIGLSDLIHNLVDNSSTSGLGVVVHMLSAFAILWILDTFLYVLLWYGRGS